MTLRESVWFDTCAAFLNEHWVPERSYVAITLKDKLHPEYKLEVTRWRTSAPVWFCLRNKNWPCEDGIYVPEEKRSFRTLRELRDYLVPLVDTEDPWERTFFAALDASLIDF